MECACSRSAQSYLQRGNRFFDQGKFADAELEYRNSIKKDPKLAEAYYRLGLTELQLQRPVDAFSYLQHAVGLNGANDIYHVQLANLALLLYQAAPSDQNLFNEVSNEAQRLLSKNPDSYDGLRLEANIRMIDRRPAEALALFQRIDAVEPYDPNVELPMVQLLFNLHRPQDAETVAQRFLAKRKDFAPMYQLLLSYYQAANRPQDAERLLQMQAQNRPKDGQAWLQLAAFYGDTHREQEMSQALDHIRNDPRDFPQGHGMVGDFYAGGSRWDDALREYREGLRGDSKYRHLYETKIATTLISAGKRKEAISELGEILKTFPKDSNARLSRAMLLSPSEQPKELELAIADLKALIRQNPSDATAHYNLATAYRTEGDLQAAEAELKKSISLRPDYIAPNAALAEIALAEHNYAEAERVSNNLLSLEPKNFDNRLLHVAALAGERNFLQARNELSELLRERPNSVDANLQRAALDAAQKRYPDAEAMYKRLYQPGASDLRPLTGLLQLYAAEHQPGKAQALLDAEAKKDPNSPSVHLLLASAAMNEGKLDAAQQQYEWVRSADPNSLEAYESLGAIYGLQGKTKDALRSYQKASQLAPKDPRILGSIAILQSNSGDSHGAIQTLEKELRLDPNNPQAMNNLAYNLAQAGADLDRALALAEAAVRKSPNNPAFLDTLGTVYAKRGLNESAVQVFRILVKKFPKEKVYRDHLNAVASHETSHASLQAGNTEASIAQAR